MTAQASDIIVLQNAATADGNGTAASVQGSKGLALVEVVEANTGTCTLTLEGSFDGKNWYSVGYQRVDAQAAPARTVTGIAVAQNGKTVYQILDFYPQVRARISASSSETLTAKLYTVPV